MTFRACGRYTTCFMAEHSRFNCLGLVTCHLCYISRELNGPTLFKYCPSDWFDVHIGIYSSLT